MNREHGRPGRASRPDGDRSRSPDDRRRSGRTDTRRTRPDRAPGRRPARRSGGRWRGRRRRGRPARCPRKHDMLKRLQLAREFAIARRRSGRSRPSGTFERRRDIFAAVGFADADDSRLGPQFDDIAQKVRTVAAAGGQQRRVGQCDRGDLQARDRQWRASADLRDAPLSPEAASPATAPASRIRSQSRRCGLIRSSPRDISAIDDNRRPPSPANSRLNAAAWPDRCRAWRLVS